MPDSFRYVSEDSSSCVLDWAFTPSNSIEEDGFGLTLCWTRDATKRL